MCSVQHAHYCGTMMSSFTCCIPTFFTCAYPWPPATSVFVLYCLLLPGCHYCMKPFTVALMTQYCARMTLLCLSLVGCFYFAWYSISWGLHNLSIHLGLFKVLSRKTAETVCICAQVFCMNSHFTIILVQVSQHDRWVIGLVHVSFCRRLLNFSLVAILSHMNVHSAPAPYITSSAACYCHHWLFGFQS